MATAYLVPVGQTGSFSNGDYGNIDGGTYGPSGTPTSDVVNSADGQCLVTFPMTNWSAGAATAIKLHCWAKNYGVETITLDISLNGGVDWEGGKGFTPDGGGGWNTTADWNISSSNLDNLVVRDNQGQFIEVKELTAEITYTEAGSSGGSGASGSGSAESGSGGSGAGEEIFPTNAFLGFVR